MIAAFFFFGVCFSWFTSEAASRSIVNKKIHVFYLAMDSSGFQEVNASNNMLS